MWLTHYLLLQCWMTSTWYPVLGHIITLCIHIAIHFSWFCKNFPFERLCTVLDLQLQRRSPLFHYAADDQWIKRLTQHHPRLFDPNVLKHVGKFEWLRRMQFVKNPPQRTIYRQDHCPLSLSACLKWDMVFESHDYRPSNFEISSEGDGS